MPWCPICKNEYKEGYTVCADCGAQLVASLEEAPKKDAITEEMLKMQNAAMEYSQMSEEELQAMEEEKKQLAKELLLSPYEDADKKAEEYKSGANALLIVGVIGLFLIVLLNLGILPIVLASFTKTMITLVMGAMFVIFIITGVLSRKSYQKIRSQADVEKKTQKEMMEYLKNTVSAEEFDKELTQDAPSMEILYFRRMEKLKAMVLEKEPEMDLSFAEYILEEVYPELFEQS